MSKNSSVIEINGKRYDAITGKLIGAVKRIAQPAASGSIDGFTRVKAQIVRTAKPHLKHPSSTVHRGAQKGKTLMRRSVRRPSTLKNLPKTVAARSLGAVNSARLTRAAVIHRSPRISRYSAASKAASKDTNKPVPGELITPGPLVQSQSGVALAKPLPSMVTSVSHQRLERMLDEALAKADAHKKMLKQLQKRSSWHKLGVLPKWFSVTVITVGMVLALGLFAWQKIPAVSLKLAASKAGISADVPTYRPDGFSVQGPVKYQAGSVVVNYGASGAQGYSLSQKASDWDSASLAANAVPSDTPVQTSEVKGTTVYIYGPSNDATWVNNGIRYTLKDKANLSSDQIIKIANSL